jgi:hypothetical protein
MNATRRLLIVSGVALSAPWLVRRAASAVSLTVANSNFESPTFADGGFATSITAAQQGGYDWNFIDSSGIYNPPAQDYTGAAASGTPAGADGSHVGWIAGTNGDFALYQRLAGVDGMVGNGDDPVLEPFTIYTLTFAVGQRAAGNLYGATAGGYDVQLRAGPNVITASIVAREADAVPLQPGNFIERTIVFDSALANPDHFGLPLTILLKKPSGGSIAATDFDNFRLDATVVPFTADFNGSGVVDGADLAVWNIGFGASGTAATPAQGDVDRNLNINGADFLQWQRQSGSGMPSARATAAIPEPAAGLLLLVNFTLTRAGRTRGNAVAWRP